jgi:hypothetical protein
MTNEEFKLKRIEDQLDFIIYILGSMDLGDISKEDAEVFNRMYERSLKKISQTKIKEEASNELLNLTSKINVILQDFPELQETVKFYTK